MKKITIIWGTEAVKGIDKPEEGYSKKTYEFKNDMFHGKGKYYYSNGDKFEGEFKNGKVSGKGKHFHKNGDKYIGDYKNDKRDGIGILKWFKGGNYTGEFKNGKMSGKGKITYEDGKTAITIDGEPI